MAVLRAVGQWKPAQEVFEQMLPCGCKPDAVSYGILISAFERGGQWCRAIQVCTPSACSPAGHPSTPHSMPAGPPPMVPWLLHALVAGSTTALHPGAAALQGWRQAVLQIFLQPGA